MRERPVGLGAVDFLQHGGQAKLPCTAPVDRQRIPEFPPAEVVREGDVRRKVDLGVANFLPIIGKIVCDVKPQRCSELT